MSSFSSDFQTLIKLSFPLYFLEQLFVSESNERVSPLLICYCFTWRYFSLKSISTTERSFLFNPAWWKLIPRLKAALNGWLLFIIQIRFIICFKRCRCSKNVMKNGGTRKQKCADNKLKRQTSLWWIRKTWLVPIPLDSAVDRRCWIVHW